MITNARATWLLIATYTIIGCSGGNGGNGGGGNANSDVPKEAYDAAKSRVLDVGFKNCGDYWGSFHPRDMVYPDIDYQFKNLHLVVANIGQPLSASDKLNGVEWEGLVSLAADATRQRVKGEKDWGAWSDGFSGSFNSNMTLIKSKGQWKVVGIELLGAKAACPT